MSHKNITERKKGRKKIFEIFLYCMKRNFYGAYLLFVMFLCISFLCCMRNFRFIFILTSSFKINIWFSLKKLNVTKKIVFFRNWNIFQNKFFFVWYGVNEILLLNMQLRINIQKWFSFFAFFFYFLWVQLFIHI